MDPGETALLEGSFHPWVPQSGSKHPVETGAEARGMDAPHRGGGADLEEIWESPGRLVCVSRDLTMSPLVLSNSSNSTGAGCHGADVAETSSVCLPPDRSAPGSSVRALDTYVHRADLWRKSDQLFVCYGPHKKGITANKQTLRRWIVDAITTAYESSDLPSPLGVRAHSIRSMVASKALSSGTSLQDICDAVGWTTPLTVARFYSLGLQATQGSSVLSA